MTALSRLRIEIAATDSPDLPEVTLIVDDAEPFALVAPDWRGFDPDAILDSSAPLVPDLVGRRVAVRRCSCGVAGCGLIAPLITDEPDAQAISWTDFRDYTGVFHDDRVTATSDASGRPWELPELRFDREQYVEEVRRASADRSWETPRRQTARLVEEELDHRALGLPGFDRDWVSPAWDRQGTAISFLRVASDRRSVDQVLLRVVSRRKHPAEAARDVAEQLARTDPQEWQRRFRWDRATRSTTR